MLVSQNEKDLVLAIGEIEYGTLSAVELEPDQSRDLAVEVSGQMKALINILRDEGFTTIDTITVHQGVPTHIEVFGAFHGYWGRKKIQIR